MPAARIMLYYSIKWLNVSKIQVLFIQVHWLVDKYACLNTFMSLGREKSKAQYCDKLRARPSTDARISEVGITLVPKRIRRQSVRDLPKFRKNQLPPPSGWKGKWRWRCVIPEKHRWSDLHSHSLGNLKSRKMVPRNAYTNFKLVDDR